MDHREIQTIRTQYQAGQWPQFLQMIQIGGLRGWTGQSVELNFPVVAVVGENGTGKSTLLKVAACIYSKKEKTKNNKKDMQFYPSNFFVETVWDQIQGVELNYRVKQGPNVDNLRIKKLTKRWRGPDNPPSRPVFLLDIARTLPLDASAGYAKIAKQAASEIESTEINEDFRDRLSHVLSRGYKKARFATSDVDAKRQVGLLEREWGELSQFHQGAGEDSTLDLFRTLQGIPMHSLLLIDEVEASLHPRAQRRLMRFLLWLARQRRIQVILTTHSPFVLEELPQEARILLLTGAQGLSIVYGVTPEFAMSRIDDDVHPDVHVFVEDREAKTLLREILASSSESANLLARIDVSPVGPANVVTLLGKLGQDGKLPYKSVAVLDGDNTDPNCLSLPGVVAPERMVYSDLKEKGWPNLSDRFGVGAGTLLAALEDAILEPDHHKWNAKVGDQVLKSSTSVWEIMASEWCRCCLQQSDRATLAEAILAEADREGGGRAGIS